MKNLYIIVCLIILILSISYFYKNVNNFEKFKSVNKTKFIENNNFEPDEDFGDITKEPYPIDNVKECTF